MLNMGPILDLAGLKTAFSSLVKHAEPDILPAFMLWVDLKVSEFKVTGTLPNGPKLAPQDLSQTVNMVLDDLQRKCTSLVSNEETCGTQTSPISQRVEGLLQKAPTDLSQKSLMAPVSSQIYNYSQTLPTDLSLKGNKQFASEYSPRKSMKSIIDNIVKQETLASSSYAPRFPLHMSLPVMMPGLPPPPVSMGMIAQHHASVARFLSHGPVFPTDSMSQSYSDAHQLNQKHNLPDREYFPHKKFRPDGSINSEDAASIKKEFPCNVTSMDGSRSSSSSPEKENKPAPDSLDNQTPVKHQVNSALRELLTAKLAATNNNQENDCESDKLVIDEDAGYDNGEFDSDISQGPLNEDDMHDRSRQPNTCQVCGQSFQYRSSFRRHMKVHQGIFSHVCAVCGRKFTRKEHFIRHKCSRKPNKASRGAHTDSPVNGVTPKVEFPPMQSPECRSEVSYDSSFTDFPESPAKLTLKSLPNGESRRKAAVPRRVVMVEEGEQEISVENCHEYSDNHGNNEQALSPVSSAGYPSPAKSNSVMSCASPCRYSSDMYPSPRRDQTKEIESYVNDDTPSARSDVYSPVTDPSGCSPHRDGYDVYPEALDLSRPMVSSSCSPPQGQEATEPNSKMAAFTGNLGLTSQQEFTIETGNYKVVTGEGDDDNSDHTKYIKVVKQGNYLKLKEEAQMIGGQLCFVCPTCSKVFHRSSNFSRHMRIHRGVYSYVCPNCQRGFFRREHFQKHKCSRRGMSHTWDRKTKIDMVLAANENAVETSDAECGSEIGDIEESFPTETAIQ